MPFEDENSYIGMQEGCSIHGDENMAECNMCGVEFCVTCLSGQTICEDCKLEADNDLISQTDFENMDDVAHLLPDDEEVEKLIEDSEELDLEELEDELESEFSDTDDLLD